nr:Antolefinin (Antolefinine) [Hymenolepis microstoma]
MAGAWNERSWWPEPDEADVSLARDNLEQILGAYRENPEKAKESLKYKDEVMIKKEGIEKDKYRAPLYKVSGPDIRSRKRRLQSEEEDIPKGMRSRCILVFIYIESFVIKVFDRSVDFGQFPENAALYSMARAWIRNLSQNDKSTWNDIPNNDDDRDSADQLPDCHYALPKPNDGLTDDQVRVPPPMPSSGQPFVINVENPPKEMSPEGLLEQHITRWREIRRKWKAACRENEERYRESYIILREMYDKFCKDLP